MTYLYSFVPSGIAAFADAHSCIDLASSADSFARSHFSEVVQTEEFMMISQSQLLRLISDDGLNVHSEERVFEAVLAWVKYDTSTREVSILFCHLKNLMQLFAWVLNKGRFCYTKASVTLAHTSIDLLAILRKSLD